MGEQSLSLLVAAAALGLVGFAGMAVSVMERRRTALIRAALRPFRPFVAAAGRPWTPPARPFGPVAASLTPSDSHAVSTFLALEPTDIRAAGFRSLPFPAMADWRAGPGRWESHQDFAAYTRVHRQESFHLPRMVVLRPVGSWPPEYRRFMPALLRFTAIFFQRPARWGKPLRLEFSSATGLREAVDGSVWRQYPTQPILKDLFRSMPMNGFAALGVALADLYTDQKWDFVAGHALLREGVGVYSLAGLFEELAEPNWTPDQIALGLERSLKVLSHELGHVLGLQHCVVYGCGMNGCNNPAELDRNPLPFCPACLAKLAWRLRLDVGRRYRELAEFFAIWKLDALARWYLKQADRFDLGRLRQKAARMICERSEMNLPAPSPAAAPSPSPARSALVRFWGPSWFP